MRWRPLMWLLLSVSCFLGAFYFWQKGDEWAARRHAPGATPTNGQAHPPAPSPQPTTTATNGPVTLLSSPGTLKSAPVSPSTNSAAPSTARFARRLSNTSQTVGQLAKNEHALLLENALVDTALSASLPIPEHLRAKGDPGSYIVQARGVLDDAFRALLQRAGATIISYLPNNAYLVRASAAAAARIQAADAQTQAVLPYEPYYKLKSSLLDLAVDQAPLPENSGLKLLLFADAEQATVDQLGQMGVEVLGKNRSPFGPVLNVRPPAQSLVAVARLAGVQVVEWLRSRVAANDLSRATVGVAPDSITQSNYLGLTGKDIIVNVNDTGVDATHPELAPRVSYDFLSSGEDTDGHGTHVAGIIASSGQLSLTVTNAQGSIMPTTDLQFRGIAYEADIFSMTASLDFGPVGSDAYLQETAVQNGALISNNSWHYASDNDYDLAAASYDAAVRDALPLVSGSQPLLFVFAAGNSGRGDDNGTGGLPDTIQSPATAKNVITVGAVEQPRNILDEVYKCTTIGTTTNDQTTVCETNQPWIAATDSADQVAGFSSRGNVGIGIEGDFGRFKPDVVAPGTFVVSTRSQKWDQAAYYDPTSHLYQSFSDLLALTNSLWVNPLFIPDNAVHVQVDVSPNPNSPIPFPDMPIFVRKSDLPTTRPGGYDFIKTNSVSVPPDTTLSPTAVNWYYGIFNETTQAVAFDLFTDITVTNELGNYFEVLSNLNNKLGPYYRYESGTSMAAADASGTLALMQEFFQKQLKQNSSPALMKALLINGARSAGALYDLRVQNFLNWQGWGMINLTNSLPVALTNSGVGATSLFFVDQSADDAIATGHSHTRKIAVSDPAAQGLPLRITLVWTDSPGNPVASMKLVNDLDLIVTNLDTLDVFVGNDIMSGTEFNQPWDTNGPPNSDSINNVENVYLSEPVGTNYSVTVYGRRVNVNAVSTQTNNVEQDYALVISSGEGQVADALTLTERAVLSVNAPEVTPITNSFASDPHDLGEILLHQRAGANPQLAGTAVVPYNDGEITLGLANQWHFYAFTNSDTGFTNAAFLTFLPPNLSVPRMGVREFNVDNASRPEADIELYVSRDPNLTNLVPAVIAAADKSVGRGGTETIVYSNAATGIYYVAVKSEDQEAAEYGLMGVFSDLPFGSQDEQGNLHLRGIPAFAPIPDGTSQKPGGTYIFGIAAFPITAKRVVVTNIITHQLMGDLLGTFSHGRSAAVLNNHSPHTGVTNQMYIYDDSDSHDIPLSRRTDGPGSLEGFGGQPAVGQWMLTMVDNEATHTGTNVSLGIFIEKQQDLTQAGGINVTILPGACDQEFLDIPVDATNLIVDVGIVNGSPPLSVQVCPVGGSGSACKSIEITTTNLLGEVILNKSAFPPLNVGTYVIRVCNDGINPVEVNIRAKIEVDIGGVTPVNFTSYASLIPDDAVSYSSIFVGEHQKIASVEVGLRVDHPRVSDLVFHLISPSGTRVLLFENRGADSPDGLGSGHFVTNVFPTTSAGDFNADTNVLDVGQNQGILFIDYDFFSIPDQLQIYYDNGLVFDSGEVSGPGRFTISFGPGFSTNIAIVMNQGNNSNPGTKWTYTATVVSPVNFSYLTFSEDPKRTTTPIKFAIPPFGLSNPPGTIKLGDFEGGAADIPAPGTVEGWTVGVGPVSVIQDGSLANTGNGLLALAGGTLSRTLPTLVGHKYRLNYSYRGPGIVGFWRAEGNPNDSVASHNGIPTNVGYTNGEVGQAFFFNPFIGLTRLSIPDQPAFELTNSLSIEGWIKPQGDGYLLWRGDSRGGLDPYYLTVEGNHSLTFSVSSLTANALVNAPLAYNQWSHVAGTLEGASGNLKLFINGALVRTSPTPVRPFADLDPTRFPSIGIGNVGEPAHSFPYFGEIDEISLYGRALSAAEVQAISAAGAAGKFDAAAAVPIPRSLAEARVTVDGVTTNVIFGENNIWQSQQIEFVATQNGTPMLIEGLEPGMLLDSITIRDSGGGDSQYVLPEESLDVLKGENAFGEWKLEIADTRTGATNPVPLLDAWQLRFIFQTITPVPTPLTYGVPGTNTIPPGQIAYFSVTVPGWARFATNILVSATAPVNLWFNQSALPTGTNLADVNLLANSTGGIGNPILAVGSNPPLVPGATYFLGVENPNGVDVTVVVQVDFDITPLANGVPVLSSIDPGALPRYFYYNVSTNAVAVSFQLLDLNGNVDLVAHWEAPVPDLQNYDYGSFNFSTNDELITVLTNSRPVFLTPGRWYLGVFNTDIATVNYTIVATEVVNGPTNIISLINMVPFFNTNSGIGFASDYYLYSTIGHGARRAQFEVDNPSGDVTLVARKGLPLPDPSSFDLISANPDTNDELIVFYDYSQPVPLTEGDWYLTVANLAGRPVSYKIMASDWPEYGTNIVITNWFISSNELCLTWTALVNAHYHVLGLTNVTDLNPGFWVTVSPTIVATNDRPSYCIPLPSPWEFFLIAEGNVPVYNPVNITNGPPVSSVSITSSGSLVQFTAPAKNRYRIEWTDSADPPKWKSFREVITSATFRYSFLDDGSQSGGVIPTRRYRVVRVQ